MKGNKFLELLRKIYSMSSYDVWEVFGRPSGENGIGPADHMNRKYEAAREKHGGYGNFHFIFYLDNENFALMYKHLLSKFKKKDEVQNTKDFMAELTCPHCKNIATLIDDTYCCEDCGASFQVVQEPQPILLEDALKTDK
jgi:hypothetical protein